MTGDTEGEGAERRSREEARRVRWGGGDQRRRGEGCKLIIDRSVGMLESVFLIRSVNSVHVKFPTLRI